MECFTGDGFEVTVEVGEIIESAFITYISNAFLRFGQQLTGMPYPHFHQELRGKVFLMRDLKYRQKELGLMWTTFAICSSVISREKFFMMYW